MACIPRAGMTAAALRSKLSMGNSQSSVTSDRKGRKSRTSSSSPDLVARRERRDCRSRPWATSALASASLPSLAVSESAATETLCTHYFDSEDTSLSASAASSVLELPILTTRIPAPRRTQTAPRRYVTYARAKVTAAYRTTVRALTPRERASVPRMQAGRRPAVFCRLGMHQPIDKAPIDKLARAMKAMIRIGNGPASQPALRSALKGGRFVYGRGAGKNLRFRCCAHVYEVESWKDDLRRETWKDLNGDDPDCTPFSEDEPDYKGLAWLDQLLDSE